MKTILSRRAAIALTVAGVISIALIYAFFDPASPWFPRCPIKAVTGLDCPGCGSQRAIHALFTGQVADAFAYNPLLFLLLPFAIAVIILEWTPSRYPQLRHRLTSTPAILLLFAIITLWTIIRNCGV